MFEFIQEILTGNMADKALNNRYNRTPTLTCLSTNAMNSRHLKILSGHNIQNLDFEAPKFCQSFSPFRSVGLFCLRAWPGGRGSRGNTPLHKAAFYGHVVAVQRLLEAKAAVDAKTDEGRGLGRGFGKEDLH